MAPKKGKETLLELCTQASHTGNSLSVRMLEYLSTVKHPRHGFRELATEFLETCRILFSIEAGLSEASNQRNPFPVDMVKELERKFRQLNDDFSVLNQTLIKLLDYERKEGISRLGKGFRLLFSDTDIDQIRRSLAKNREALRMSAMVFRWSLGDARADAQFGIGYTGLMAALDRMNGAVTTVLTPLSPQPELEALDGQHPKIPVSTSVAEIKSISDATVRSDDFPAVPGFPERQSSQHAPSSTALDSPPWPLEANSYRRPGLSPIGRSFEDGLSDSTTNDSRTYVEDHLDQGNGKPTGQPIRVKADPTAAPRWTPRQSSSGDIAATDSALLVAIQRRQHKTIEQLLDSGAKPDGSSEHNLLRVACYNHDADSVRMLLLFGANPNIFDRERFTPLFSATKSGFLDGAKMLIKYGANPNLSAGPDSDTPLALAIAENKIDFVQLLLMYGGDAALIMENGNTPLIEAISKTVHLRLVEMILRYDCDADAKNDEGKTALLESILVGRHDIVELLLDNGANPNLPGPKHPLWPATYKPRCLEILLARGADAKKCPGIMELASSIKSAESISILLKAGVSPNIKKDGVYTPLCSAIRDNSTSIVTLLLANGADPNLPASEYPAFKCVTHHRVNLLPQLVAAGADLRSPKGIIEKAVAHDNMEAFKYLLEKGVNVNDKTPDGGCTALTTAIREDRPEMIDLLLANGADPSIRGQDWPIIMAVKRPKTLQKILPMIANPRAIRGVMEQAVVANQLESIKLLLAAGVSVEDKNGGVFSPLTTAIREHRTEIVRFLLDEGGADINAAGEHLPIIKAIRRYRDKGDTEIIEMLLARGVDINKMYRGWNAILQALVNGDIKVLQLLTERGGRVDLTATDENGRSVLEIVNEQGWDEAMDLLTANGAGDNGKYSRQ